MISTVFEIVKKNIENKSTKIKMNIAFKNTFFDK